MDISSKTDDELEDILARCHKKIVELEYLEVQEERSMLHRSRQIKGAIDHPLISVNKDELKTLYDQINFAIIGRTKNRHKNYVAILETIDFIMEIELEKFKRCVSCEGVDFGFIKELIKAVNELKNAAKYKKKGF